MGTFVSSAVAPLVKRYATPIRIAGSCGRIDVRILVALFSAICGPPAPRQARRGRFSIEAAASSAVLLDRTDGRAWILQPPSDGEIPKWAELPASVPVWSPLRVGAPRRHVELDANAKPASGAVRTFLKGRGYHGIGLRRVMPGYYLVAGKVKGISVAFLLDVGSSATWLDFVGWPSSPLRRPVDTKRMSVRSEHRRSARSVIADRAWRFSDPRGFDASSRLVRPQ